MNIEILSKAELKLFNTIVPLTFKQKKHYFEIEKCLLKKLENNYKIENIPIFILLFGYFKITNKFCTINDDDDNLEFISKEYEFSNYSNNISERTIRAYKSLIRQHLQINDYTDKIKLVLQKEANNLANNFIHRKKIFYTLVHLSKKLNIEIPSYTELTRIITVALNTQQKDI